MTASTLEPEKTCPGREPNDSQANSIGRSGFYIEGRGEPFFAWLHQNSTHRSHDHGVIICPPIGYEQLHSHRSLRHLADNLAIEKIPTLRFDWHGTGDSPGFDEDPNRCTTWLANIRDAVQWMRQQLGCRQISLVGLRLGAAFATLVTEHSEIDHLVLWSPVVKGRAYVREMTALSLTSEAPIRRPTIESEDIEAGGFTLSSQTAKELSTIDLLKYRPRCQRALIVSRSDFPADDRLLRQWATTGTRVEQIAAPGYAEMMVDPHHSQLPNEAIREITTWLSQAIAVDCRERASNIQVIRTSSIPMQGPALASNPEQIRSEIRESTFRISSQPDLFGIVSEPTAPANDHLPTVVLLNAGASYRIGASRLNVLIARQIASQGFRCLRMDLNGLGDSISASLNDENDSYSPTMFRDIEIALKQVERCFGAKRIVLTGLCSGAYAAFQSAAQISNPVLVESILINPLTFFWTQGMTLDTSPTKHLMSFHHYLSVAADPRRWIRLLSGKSKIGIVGAIRLVAQRFGLLERDSAAVVAARRGVRRFQGITHPRKEDLSGDLKRIERADRKLGMFFSKSDPGFSILNCHARRKANQLRSTGGLKIEFISDADHTFTLRAARSDLIHAIADHLDRQYR